MDRSIPQPWVRQVTGDPFRFLAHVVKDGKVIKTCDHNHRSRGHGESRRSGEVFAWKCAEKMAQEIRRSSDD